MSSSHTTTSRVRPRLPFWQAVGVVTQRELKVKLTSKSFLITTAITLVLLLGATLVGPRLVEAFDSSSSVAVTTSAEPSVAALGEDTEITVVGDAQTAQQAVLEGEVDAAVVPAEDSPTGVAVVGERDVPSSLVAALSAAPTVELLDPDAPDPAMTSFIALVFGLVFFMTAITFGLTIAQSVVEEKQTRIVEILLATVPARALLAGKVIGNSLLAFGQVVLYALVALIGIQVNGDRIALDGLGLPILWFVVLFTIGFVMIAALYAAAAALVSRQEDLGSVSMPIMMLIMIPYFAIIFLNDNPVALQVMSYIPFSAPVAVPMRVYLGQTPLWENLAAVAILVLATVAAIWFASRVYERSILKTGKAVTWRQALRG